MIATDKVRRLIQIAKMLDNSQIISEDLKKLIPLNIDKEKNDYTTNKLRDLYTEMGVKATPVTDPNCRVYNSVQFDTWDSIDLLIVNQRMVLLREALELLGYRSTSIPKGSADVIIP